MTNTFKIFTEEEAKIIGEKIGIDFSQCSLQEFQKGLTVELEHGSHDAATNVTSDDEVTTGKIAWAHLKEIPDYYTRLAQMKQDAE